MGQKCDFTLDFGISTDVPFFCRQKRISFELLGGCSINVLLAQVKSALHTWAKLQLQKVLFSSGRHPSLQVPQLQFQGRDITSIEDFTQEEIV
jgi:hypothetical protein